MLLNGSNVWVKKKKKKKEFSNIWPSNILINAALP